MSPTQIEKLPLLIFVPYLATFFVPAISQVLPIGAYNKVIWVAAYPIITFMQNETRTFPIFRCVWAIHKSSKPCCKPGSDIALAFPMGPISSIAGRLINISGLFPTVIYLFNPNKFPKRMIEVNLHPSLPIHIR
jgi:hypothetical protein